MYRLSPIFRRAQFPFIVILLCQALMSQGCSMESSAVRTQQKAPQATVYYEEVADWSFEAAHPARIDQAMIKQVLQGVYVSERSSSHSSSADGGKPMNVFSDEDVEHLAPLLAHALSQAQPEYVVAFRLSSSAGSGSEPTAGTFYVKDQQLHVTLTAYQGNLAKEDSAFIGDAAGVRTVSFTPASAGRTQKADPTIALGQRGLVTLAIEYDLLAKQQEEPAPVRAAATPAASEPKMPERILMASASSDDLKSPDVAMGQEPGEVKRKEQELKDAQQALARKDAKIDRLRRDLESMRQQLEAKDKELRQVKTKQTSTKREKRGRAEVVIR